MKSTMLALILFAGAAWAADQVADRAAVEKTVAGLTAFTKDFDGVAALSQLDEKPHVEISDGPWREAQIGVPGPGTPAKIAVRSVKFVTPDVAVVDAFGSGAVLFVVKSDEGVWKISSLRAIR